MRNINFIIIIGTFFISNLGFGQDTLTISKKYFVQKANDKNLQLQIANQAFKSAQADYRQSNALFLPSITASHTAISTTNPLMAFGTKLNQEVLSASDFNPALLNDPAMTQNFSVSIDLPFLRATSTRNDSCRPCCVANCACKRCGLCCGGWWSYFGSESNNSC